MAEGSEPQMLPKPYRQKGRPIPWRMTRALNITKAPMLVSTDAQRSDSLLRSRLR